MKQMKNHSLKLFLILLGISIFSSKLGAQGAYMSLNLGYSLEMNSQNLRSHGFSNIEINGTAITTEQIDLSLGKGFNFGGALGYMINENFGVEVGVSYHIGWLFEAVEETPNGKIKNTLSSTMLRVIPSLIITPEWVGVNPYAKFGMVLGSGTIIYSESTGSFGDLSKLEITMNEGLAVGLSSGIGLEFIVTNRTSIFTELNMINMSYAPAKGEKTKYIVNGTNELPNLTTSERETDYVDSYTKDPTEPQQPDERSETLKNKMPFGSIGLNVGLLINF